MLSKGWDIAETVLHKEGSSLTGTGSFTKNYTYTCQKKQYVTIIFSQNRANNIKVVVGGNTIYESSTTWFSREVLVDLGTVIQITHSYSLNSSAFTWEFKVLTWGAVIRALVPYEIKPIGERISPISYGRLPDGQRYGELSGGTLSSSAWAGEIALWNCAWYLTIVWADGMPYKVPVYYY